MIDDYLTVFATIVRAPSRDQWAEPTSAGNRERVRGYYRSSRRLIRASTGEEITATGVFVLPPGTAVGPEDRIELDGKELRPVQVDRPRSLDGEESVRVFVV